jgi:hypothetical protein
MNDWSKTLCSGQPDERREPGGAVPLKGVEASGRVIRTKEKRMSQSQEGASDEMNEGNENGSGANVDAEGPRDHQGGGQRNFGGRRKRRRQRPQRTKRRKGGPQSPKSAAVKDDTDRERIFQDIEGLLRRIREDAEENGDRSEQEMREITATVTNFTKLLEEESEVISERARVEYHRVREKLNHALRS